VKTVATEGPSTRFGLSNIVAYHSVIHGVAIGHLSPHECSELRLYYELVVQKLAALLESDRLPIYVDIWKLGALPTLPMPRYRGIIDRLIKATPPSLAEGIKS
jgi:hypothetical protein